MIPTYVQYEMIQWIINLIQKSITTRIHVFCLDFASATLANVIHTPYTLQYLEHNPRLAHSVILVFYSDNGTTAEIHSRVGAGLGFDAYFDLLELLKQG